MPRTIALLIALSAIALGQIGEPIFATVQDAEGRVLTVRGVPGAWNAAELEGTEAHVPEGWVWLPDEHAFISPTGELHLLPRAAVSVLQVVLRTATGEETPVGAFADFGEVGVRESRTVRFRVKNTGAAALIVDKLALSGSWFRIVDAFSPPISRCGSSRRQPASSRRRCKSTRSSSK